jgi:hypothetical protein
MDGRKNNKGVKGNKGGRPPKADEVKIAESMDAVAIPQKLWVHVWERVEAGDVQAQKLWAAYRFGNPRQTLDVTTNGDNITPPIEWLD